MSSRSRRTKSWKVSALVDSFEPVVSLWVKVWLSARGYHRSSRSQLQLPPSRTFALTVPGTVLEEAIEELNIASSATKALLEGLQRLASLAPKPDDDSGGAADVALSVDGLPPPNGVQLVPGWWMIVDGNGTLRFRLRCPTLAQVGWGQVPRAGGEDEDARLAKVSASQSVAQVLTREAWLRGKRLLEKEEKTKPRHPATVGQVDAMLLDVGIVTVCDRVSVASRGLRRFACGDVGAVQLLALFSQITT